MTESSIAVTGIGVLTPLGDTLSAVAQALHDGRRAPTPAPEAALAGVAEARIADFDATRYTNVRGMRIYNRTTRLGIAAAKLALTEAGLDGAGGEQLGLITASTFGHLDTLMEYDRSLVRDGIQRTNPALMPLGLPSSPGAAIALSYVAKAFSITLANDAASGLDALELGARLVVAGRARACLVVGAFAPFLELSLAARRAGFLATGDEVRVFDRRHAGTAFGEGAVAVVLERYEDARARGREREHEIECQGFIGGHASTFAASLADTASRAGALGRACGAALEMAGLAASRIDLVSAGANGFPALDLAEAQAVRTTLGASASAIPVMAVKAALGESLDAGGLFQAVLALHALRSGQVPPIAGLEEPAVSGLRYAQQATAVGGGHALVTSLSSTGACSALVLSRP